MSSTTPDDKSGLAVYHDSGCPMCRAEVGLMRKLDGDNSITWIDINAEDAPLSVAGISYEEAMKNIHVRDASGEYHKGVDGFMAMWERLPGYRRLVPLIRRVPALRSCLNVFYRLFSKARMRIYRDRVAHYQDRLE